MMPPAHQDFRNLQRLPFRGLQEKTMLALIIMLTYVSISINYNDCSTPSSSCCNEIRLLKATSLYRLAPIIELVTARRKIDGFILSINTYILLTLSFPFEKPLTLNNTPVYLTSVRQYNWSVTAPILSEQC